jgi:mono/diheme cytochrome c family protein
VEITMNRYLFALLIITGLTSVRVDAADLARGKALHDSVCLRCHQPDTYTRAKRIVHSKAELAEQVNRCQTGAGVDWNAAQIVDVAAYLNATYYKFK